MICATSGPPDSDNLRLKVDRIHSAASQTTHPVISGTRAHQRLCVAESVTTPIRTIPDDRQPLAVDIDAGEAVGEQDRRANDRRLTEIVANGEGIGSLPELFPPPP